MTVILHSPRTAVFRTAVLGLATARLTRLVTSDKITEQLAIRHIRTHAEYHPDGRPSNLWGYAQEWADCPFCSGFWVGGAVLVGEALLGPQSKAPAPLRAAWQLSIGALAMNYVVGHLSSKID